MGVQGMCFEEIAVGVTRSVQKRLTDDEILTFAEVTGDRNPVHLDESRAARSMFGGRIAHGMLTAGLISAVIGEQLPGPGAVYLSQTLHFRKPVRPNDLVEARCTVESIDPGKRRLTLDCRCSVGDTIVIDGKALILMPEPARSAA